MKNRFTSHCIGLALLFGIDCALAQNPVSTSFSQNGLLVCSGLQTGTLASVEWASSLSGPWKSNWGGLDAVTVAPNGTISVSVPMFYRVRGVPATTNLPPTGTNGMVLIPAGSFTMGDVTDTNLFGDAAPTNIYVSGFYMETNLVSYNQWTNIFSYAINHGYSFSLQADAKAGNHPVYYVDWYDCVKWCNARSVQAGITPVYYTDSSLTKVYTNGEWEVTIYVNWTANGYRLPTEAEWEKAARGGLIGQRFPWGNTISETQANYYALPNPPNTNGYTYDFGPYTGYNIYYKIGAEPYTSPVGSFSANGYGLNDMAGNVSEWCWDWYGMPYGQPTTNNPTGPSGGSNFRVLRGGDYSRQALALRCAYRDMTIPEAVGIQTGFRCVRGL